MFDFHFEPICLIKHQDKLFFFPQDQALLAHSEFQGQ